MNKGFLLDTCAVIWMSQRQYIDECAAGILSDARERSVPIHVSTATAWEMGMLVAKRRIMETRSAYRWYRDFLANADVFEHAITSEIFIDSSFLPPPVHKDPIDRILIATARAFDFTLVTRDRAILAYSEAGHVRTLAC